MRIAGVLLAAGAGLGLAAAAAQAQEVTVVRGATVETAAAEAAPLAPQVTVLRGAGAPEAAGRIVVGGARLWLVDRDTGRVTACRLRGTGRVGPRAVVCTATERD